MSHYNFKKDLAEATPFEIKSERILDKDGNVVSTSRENVREHGEVFTPINLVDDMLALIPDEKWADKSFCVIEPTSGNGQFLVRIFKKKIEAGLSVEEALNTIIGMEINTETLRESRERLSKLAARRLRFERKRKPRAKYWFKMAAKCIAIVENNIFKVDDSLSVMDSYNKQAGVLYDKKFIFKDPNGNNDVLDEEAIKKVFALLEDRFKKYRLGSKDDILTPWFKQQKAR